MLIGMRKKTISAIKLVILLIIVIILVHKKDTDVYLSLAGYSPYGSIDMQVDIDNEHVFSDTVSYTALIPKKINLPMRLGFHRVSVESNLLRIKKDKIIFLFFNQFIMIEFYNKAKFVRDNPEFEIRTHFNPFYLE